MSGKIILNGKAYSSNGTPSREVTMSEYLALPASKLTDGVVYYIKDVGGANQFPPLIYSTKEREVGVWKNGKPLYEKTFAYSVTVDVNIETNIVDLTSLSIEEIVWIQGVDHITTSSVDKWLSSSSYFQPFYNTSTKYLMFRQSYTGPSLNTLAITVQYTKTTDTPGSGIWTTDGVPTVHYSTNEKVVGTWTDGKPLYERTIIKSRVGSPAASRDYVNVEDLSSANIDKLIRAEGSWFDGGVIRKAFPWADSSATLNICYNQNTKYLQILFYGFTGYDIYDVYMIIQYTKTTD